MRFNLVTDQWIPVVWRDGRTNAPRVSLKEAFDKAHLIREVRGQCPLDAPAVYRFLFAVLHWCKPEVNVEEREQVLRTGGIPASWLVKLDEHMSRFELFGEKDGFYQDYGAWKELTDRASDPLTADFGNAASELYAELPTGETIAHFRHTRDRREGLCPACCALGLLRFSAFAFHVTHPPYQRGRPSGINGGAPVYSIPAGNNLLETLVLNWPLDDVPGDTPGWMASSPPLREEIGPMAGLTWRPRRVWLDRPERIESAEACAICGDSTYPLVCRLACLPGWIRPFGKGPWDKDPHLMIETVKTPNKGKRDKRIAITMPKVSASQESHFGVWRKVTGAALDCHKGANLRRVADDSGGKMMEAQCVGLALNDKGSACHDARAFTVGTLRDSLSSSRLRQALEMVSESQSRLRGIIIRTLPRIATGRPEVDSALARRTPGVERQIEAAYARLARAAEKATDDEWGCAVQTFAANLRRILHEKAREVLKSLAKGSALHIPDAESRLWREFDRVAFTAPTERQEGSDSAHLTEAGTPKRRKKGRVKREDE